MALNIAETHTNDRIMIFSDSMSCLQAIDNCKFSNPVILTVLEQVHDLSMQGKTIEFCWLPSHVGIKGNELADAAAKLGLQQVIDTGKKIPYSDLKPQIGKFVTSTMQEKWTNTVFNKLQPIKPEIGETKFPSNLSRKDEVVLHRARIGHTYATHCYLLKREAAPECVHCQCLLTVEHILISCPALAQTRAKHYSSVTLQDTLNKHCNKVLDFLTEINLYKLF
jgi:kelch-like protein 2/3